MGRLVNKTYDNAPEYSCNGGFRVYLLEKPSNEIS